MQARNFLGTAAAILLSATALTAQGTQKPAMKPAQKPAATTAKVTDSTKKVAATAADTGHKMAKKHAPAVKKP